MLSYFSLRKIVWCLEVGPAWLDHFRQWIQVGPISGYYAVFESSVKKYSTIVLSIMRLISDFCLYSLEIWYFQGIVLISGLLPNPTVSLDSISIWYMTIYFLLHL